MSFLFLLEMSDKLRYLIILKSFSEQNYIINNSERHTLHHLGPQYNLKITEFKITNYI